VDFFLAVFFLTGPFLDAAVLCEEQNFDFPPFTILLHLVPAAVVAAQRTGLATAAFFAFVVFFAFSIYETS